MYHIKPHSKSYSLLNGMCSLFIIKMQNSTVRLVIFKEAQADQVKM